MSVHTEALSRRFGDVLAVSELTVDLPDTGVIGLVGPNGSGKSTLIRMLLGLVQPDSGSAHVLGSSISDPGEYADRVGALIEAPAFVPGLSARDNLRALARLRGLPLTRVDKVLGIVGLEGRDQEPVRRFSLGMKQRLGIAGALLPDPRLLVLDEPTNGLDPAGIVEIRGLIGALGREGRTVIVSSHLLAEIESVCDYLVVVRFGLLVFSGTVAELLGRGKMVVGVAPEHPEDLARLAVSFEREGWAVQRDHDDALAITAPTASAADINRLATAAGITLRALEERRPSLESVFLDMTSEAAPAIRAGEGVAS